VKTLIDAPESVAGLRGRRGVGKGGAGDRKNVCMCVCVHALFVWVYIYAGIVCVGMRVGGRNTKIGSLDQVRATGTSMRHRIIV
jgi:hypothetical protein